jgi:two-component system nitrogen regulation response regulator GlnG
VNLQPRVWVVDDDASVRWVLDKALQAEGMATRCFEAPDDLLQALGAERPDVLITDVRMPGMNGVELMEQLVHRGHQFPVIVMTAHADLDTAVAAYTGGAFEYLPKPFAVDNGHGGAGTTQSSLPTLIGEAPAMQEVFRTIGRLARSSMTVLITGESGTGKELVARALHEHSPRAARPFVALNTTAIASELLESELFGHERGAFTGADSRRIGRFEQADGGTLFLDEIGDMSLALQTRLLRVLAEGEFYRVGGQATIEVDVRVIAATNQDLLEAVRAGRFREDLFHRLNVIHIRTPALRERRQDIPLLLDHYLARAAAELGGERKKLTPDSAALLQACDWPGNVRQLINACRRLTVTAAGREIQPADIPEEFGGGQASAGGEEWADHLARWAHRQLERGAPGSLLDAAMPEFERTLIRAALTRAGGRRQEAARLIGWGRNTLTRKIRELGLDV